MSLRFGLSVAVTMLVGTICFVAGNPTWIAAWAILLFLFMVFYDVNCNALEDEAVTVVAATSAILIHVSAIMGSYAAMIFLAVFWIYMIFELVNARLESIRDRRFQEEENRRFAEMDRAWEARRRASREGVNWQKEGF